MTHSANPISLSLVAQCASCRICEGAAYQAPPALAIGPANAPIAVIAQNPGEISSSETWRLNVAAQAMEWSADPKVVSFWYSFDFMTSNGYHRLASIFGDGWLKTGEFVYTNAVRCRTPKNAMPSTEMQQACATWTRQLLEGRRLVVTVGSVAKVQVLGEFASTLPLGIPRRRNGVIYLAISHYAVWAADDVETYRAAFLRAKEAL